VCGFYLSPLSFRKCIKKNPQCSYKTILAILHYKWRDTCSIEMSPESVVRHFWCVPITILLTQLVFTTLFEILSPRQAPCGLHWEVCTASGRWWTKRNSYTAPSLHSIGIPSRVKYLHYKDFLFIYVRLKTFMAHEVIKFSRAISLVNIGSNANVSETSSVSIIRVTFCLSVWDVILNI
jgi:hypothetical protein